MHARSRWSKLRKSRKAQDVDDQEVATRIELVSENSPRRSPLSTGKKLPPNGSYKEVSPLSRAALSIGPSALQKSQCSVLLTS